MAEKQHSETTLDHILKYTGVFGGVQGLVMLMSIVRNKLTSKILGAVGFGLMSEYTTITDAIHSTTNLGIPFSSVRHVSELFEQGDDDAIMHFISIVRTWCVWVALFGCAVCCAASPWFVELFFKGDAISPWHIAALSPMLLFMAITAGEASILKGMRRLKRIASITALGALSTLLLTVPVYWLWGIAGIIFALNLSTAAVAALHLAFTLPLYPWRIQPFSRAVLREGMPMIRIGVPYILAAVAGSAMAIAIQAILKRYGSDEVVGLYRVGYTIMATYAGFVFAAFEADYFPRLSSVNNDPQLRSHLINQQIHVSLLIAAPMLIGLVLFMPLLLRLLYTESFLPCTDMAVCAVFYSFFRAVTLPMSYTSLARGDSHIYLLMEVVYDIVAVALIYVCYTHWGLMGTGIGLSLSAVFDFILIGGTYGTVYGIRLTPATRRMVAAQFCAVAASLAVCLFVAGPAKYALGGLVLLLSGAYSYRILSRETEVIPRIRKKLHL